LLEDISIDQARGVLINITGSTKMTMDEVMEGSSFIKNEVHPDAEIIWGMVFDDAMADEIRITVIATGIGGGRDGKIINLREISSEEAEENWTVRLKEDLDRPTFQRQLTEKENERLLREAGHHNEKRGLLHKLFQKENLDYPTFLRKQAD
jgi:cell division protein FtsZ